MLYRLRKYFKENDESFATLAEFFMVFAPFIFTFETHWKYFGIVISILSWLCVFAKYAKHLLFCLLIGWIYIFVYACFTKSLVSVLIISTPILAYWFISKYGYRELLDKAKKNDTTNGDKEQ